MPTNLRKNLASHPRLRRQKRALKEGPKFYVIVLNDERAAEWKLAFDAVWDEMCRTGEGGEQSTRILKKESAFYAGTSVEVVEIKKEVAQALYDKQISKGWKFVVLQKIPGRKNYTRWKPSKEDAGASETAKQRSATKLVAFLNSGAIRTAG